MKATLCVYLLVRYAFCSQKIDVSYLFHIIRLYLLIGEFRPLTFKITDKYWLHSAIFFLMTNVLFE